MLSKYKFKVEKWGQGLICDLRALIRFFNFGSDANLFLIVVILRSNQDAFIAPFAQAREA